MAKPTTDEEIGKVRPSSLALKQLFPYRVVHEIHLSTRQQKNFLSKVNRDRITSGKLESLVLDVFMGISAD